MPENIKQTTKEDGFFKTVLKSIKDIDKYEQFALEGTGKTCLYLLEIVLIITIIVVAILIYQFSNTMQSAVIYFNDNVQEMTYADGILSVNSNQKLEVEPNNGIAQKIIIDTSDLSDEQINQYKEQFDGLSSGFILLKDRLLIKNEMLTDITETTYTDLLSQYNITNLDKQSVLDYIYANQTQIYISVAVAEFIYMYMIYLSSIIIDVLILAILGLIVARIIGMKIKFNNIFITAVTIVLNKTLDSLLAGINTQSEKIQLKIENIIAHVIIFKEFADNKNFSPAIISTISLLSIITPIDAGKTNILSKLITLVKTCAYSFLLFCPHSIARRGIVTISNAESNPCAI